MKSIYEIYNLVHELIINESTLQEDNLKILEKDWIFAEKYAKSHKLDREEILYKPTSSSINFVKTPVGIFILSLDTPEEYKGMGGATNLLQQVKNMKYNIYLEADASDNNKQDELEKLYIKNGFKRINDKKFYYIVE